MKKTLIAAAAALLLAAPATAQDILFPRLDWPEDVTTSTKDCKPAAVCTPSK